MQPLYTLQTLLSGFRHPHGNTDQLLALTSNYLFHNNSLWLDWYNWYNTINRILGLG